MIQDISPARLDTSYRELVPAPEDCFFAFWDGEVLLRTGEDGGLILPSFRELRQDAGDMDIAAVFLFCVDQEPLYLLQLQEAAGLESPRLRYFPVWELSRIQPGWVYFAGITALHLGHWYGRNKYCGRCGSAMQKRTGQRALACPECGNTVYPYIAPVVMVAVTNGDKLLMTKYAGRSISEWVLISGFVEVGETLEEAAAREAFEETGIHIKGLRYFGSQPWGFSDSVIVGYTAVLEGPDEIHLDREELAEAKWHPRSELPEELTDISIAYEMIESLRI